jgi:hypothetical protein
MDNLDLSEEMRTCLSRGHSWKMSSSIIMLTEEQDIMVASAAQLVTRATDTATARAKQMLS